MRNLILVSKTPIVIQIFNLVCKKLNINIEVLKEAQIDHKVDIIVMDKEFIDDRFTILKSYTKQIGAITNDELSFEMACDFQIPSPFLPSKLEAILDEQLQIITKKVNSKTYISNIPEEELNIDRSIIPDDIEDDESLVELDPHTGIDEELDPAIDYLDSIADNIVSDFNEENDDSVVMATTLQNEGGVLDLNELSKIEEMINPINDIGEELEDAYSENINDKSSDDEWLDLSSIIDQAINEVNTTEHFENDFENKPIKLLLNEYSMNELEPLLSLLNQDLIDSLTDGYEITLKLKLKGDND